MTVIAPQTLIEFIRDIFIAAETPPAHAEQVATSLVGANLAGHDSHGVIRTPQYIASIRSGNMDATATPAITSERGSVTMIDGRAGFGQVAARKAIEVGIEKAREFGSASVGLYNSGHVGRVGEWVEIAAAEKMIGIAFCNNGRPGGFVAPFGGAEGRFGTNPFAAAVPQREGPPVLLDFATSVVAEGKIRVARNSGKELPPGRILDKQREPSTNPHDFYDGGLLLPAAEHKGYGLALLMDLLGGLLTGGGAASLPNYGTTNGVLFIVLDVEAFRPLSDFLADTDALTTILRETPPLRGVEQVLVPGDPEVRSRAAREEGGIPLDAGTWLELTNTAGEFGVALPPTTD